MFNGGAWATSLRSQNILMPQGTLQRGLHLHIDELADSEARVLQCFALFHLIMLRQEFNELEVDEGCVAQELSVCTRLFL